jgi:hypothetical protein
MDLLHEILIERGQKVVTHFCIMQLSGIREALNQFHIIVRCV